VHGYGLAMYDMKIGLTLDGKENNERMHGYGMRIIVRRKVVFLLPLHQQFD